MTPATTTPRGQLLAMSSPARRPMTVAQLAEYERREIAAVRGDLRRAGLL